MGQFKQRRKAQTITLGLLLLCIIAGATDTGDVKKRKRWDNAERTARTNLLQSAERWKDVRELTGNNDHPMITKSMKQVGLRGDRGYAWCSSSQCEIAEYAGTGHPNSARVVDWGKANVIWCKDWGVEFPYTVRTGMMALFWNERLNREAHIGMIVSEDLNNYYIAEGNTSPKGAIEWENIEELNLQPDIRKPLVDFDIVREAKTNGGFYLKVRPKSSVYAIVDRVLLGDAFNERYWEYLLKCIAQYERVNGINKPMYGFKNSYK